MSGDFSKAAVEKAVLTATLQHPLTLYPIAVGVVGVAAVVLLIPSFGWFLAAVGAVALGIGSWIVNFFFRSDVYADRYIQSLHDDFARQRQARLESLQEALEVCQTVPGAGHLASQGAEQFVQIREKFDNLVAILDRKLNRHELTYHRYCGSAEQVYLSVLDHLRDVVTLLQSVRAIDPAYVQQRQAALQALANVTPADAAELSTLNERQQLYSQQLERVNVLLTQNEAAMTTLDQTTAALADMKTVAGRASVDMETARQALEALAQRADAFSIESTD
ncbi:hypothetical protein [Candidatus Entotheonella palauensis]|uniref:Uncharacterized protein n=1 Tax=Candidatus Entotheonella gemina TaxID=1429439 RepID=W4M3U3_9BACT|nr:hypothetical protein [Candidatus Entotheonella palauensis]ETX05029.1 MAG: hypothetical protein ETSY2_25365 [Candidatus Entotheonella gemina]